MAVNSDWVRLAVARTGPAWVRAACCASTADTPGMKENIPLSGSIDLDALDDYLMSDHAPDDCMGLSDLDGFLTGVVVGPELILPSEWMPMIWGGDEHLFATEEEMRKVLGTIVGRYNEIAACFNVSGVPPPFRESSCLRVAVGVRRATASVRRCVSAASRSRGVSGDR
jgi:hypothetical protein